MRSHLWIGLGAFVQVGSSTLAYSYHPSFSIAEREYALAVSLGAVAFYGLYRYGRVPRRPSPTAIANLVCALIAAGLYAFELRPEARLSLLPAIAAASLYWLAGWRYRGSSAFGWAKPLLLAAVWAAVTTAIPLHLAQDGTGPVGLGPVIGRLAFFLAIGLASDFPHAEADARGGLRTVTGTLGRTPTRYVCIALLLASALLSVGSYLNGRRASTAIALTSLLAAPVLWGAFRQNRERHRYVAVYVDGLLVLPLPIYFALASWA